MTPKQLSVLKSLVDYAAKHTPRGLTDHEREVVHLVNLWARTGYVANRTHNYAVINTSHHNTIAEAANSYADRGWRVVGALPPRGPGHATVLIIERPVGVSHPDD